MSIYILSIIKSQCIEPFFVSKLSFIFLFVANIPDSHEISVTWDHLMLVRNGFTGKFSNRIWNVPSGGGRGYHFFFFLLYRLFYLVLSNILPSVVLRKQVEVSNTNVHISALNCYNRLLRKFTGHYCWHKLVCSYKSNQLTPKLVHSPSGLTRSLIKGGKSVEILSSLLTY